MAELPRWFWSNLTDPVSQRILFLLKRYEIVAPEFAVDDPLLMPPRARCFYVNRNILGQSRTNRQRNAAETNSLRGRHTFRRSLPTSGKGHLLTEFYSGDTGRSGRLSQ
jgi:hypothetical protein